jgi:hypothetical protein
LAVPKRVSDADEHNAEHFMYESGRPVADESTLQVELAAVTR